MTTLVLGVIQNLAKWMRTREPRLWSQWAENEAVRGGTRALRSELSAAYKQSSQERPKSLIQQAFRVDTPSHPASLPQWAQEIQPFLANQLSIHTRRAYQTDLRQFFEFLEGKIAPDELLRLRPQHIILYRKFLEEGRMTGTPFEKSTVNRKLAVVKSFFNWLKVNQLVHDNPAQLVKGFPQNQESSLKGLSDSEARQLLDGPRTSSRAGALHRAVLYTLLYTGLRKGELIQLQVGDIGEERGVRVIRVRGKGHRVRVLPLVPIVYVALQEYFNVCGREWSDKEAALFSPTKNPRTGTLHKPLNPNAITYIVLRYARKAGILKKISPHSCRATCISNALDRKASHRAVQHLAGWSTPLMIQRYDKRREELKNSAAYVVNYSEGDSFTS